MMKVMVLTVSDRASEGVYEDLSGPAVENVLSENLKDIKIIRKIVPDEPDKIEEAFSSGLENDFIISTGGTGIGPRDITPEVTEKFCEKMIPGVAELLRNESLKQTQNAVFSRGLAGTKGKTMIVNLPGSVKGAKFCTEILVSILSHAKKMLNGAAH